MSDDERARLVASVRARVADLELELLTNGHVRIPIDGAGGAHVLVVLTGNGDLLVTLHGPGEEPT